MTITAEDKAKVYDNDVTDDPTLTATVTGAVEGDQIYYTLGRTAGQDAKEYVITVTPGENPNYNVTAVNGKFTITPKTVTITAQDHTFASNGTSRSWDRYDVDGLAFWLAKLEGESAVTRLELMRDFTNSEEYRKYQDTLKK